jgi:hypothetical protein
MTTTRIAAPRNCTSCNVKLTSKNRTSTVVGTLMNAYNDLCVKCYESDDEEWVDDVADVAPVATGRTNRSHAECAHPRTPAGRAACRKAAKTS